MLSLDAALYRLGVYVPTRGIMTIDPVLIRIATEFKRMDEHPQDDRLYTNEAAEMYLKNDIENIAWLYKNITTYDITSQDLEILKKLCLQDRDYMKCLPTSTDAQTASTNSK